MVNKSHQYNHQNNLNSCLIGQSYPHTRDGGRYGIIDFSCPVALDLMRLFLTLNLHLTK